MVGIRFSRRIFSGRISCVFARVSVMTNMFSLRSALAAGRSFGMRIGMMLFPRFCVLMAGFGAIDANLYFIILLLREMSNRG